MNEGEKKICFENVTFMSTFIKTNACIYPVIKFGLTKLDWKLQKS